MGKRKQLSNKGKDRPIMSTPEYEKWKILRRAFKKELQEIVEETDTFDNVLSNYKIINDTQDNSDNATPTRVAQIQNAIYDDEGSIHYQLYARFQTMEAFGTVIDITQHHTEFPDHYRDRGLTETQTKTRTQHIHLTNDNMHLLIIAWIDWLEKQEKES